MFFLYSYFILVSVHCFQLNSLVSVCDTLCVVWRLSVCVHMGERVWETQTIYSYIYITAFLTSVTDGYCHHVDAGNWTRCSGRTASAVTHWAPSCFRIVLRAWDGRIASVHLYRISIIINVERFRVEPQTGFCCFVSSWLIMGCLMKKIVKSLMPWEN